jgi:Fe-S-cluster containining protein
MKIYINREGEITCTPPDAQATVAELIGAVQEFCLVHIDCSCCRDTCCTGLAVFGDNVFIKQLLRMSREAVGDQYPASLILYTLHLDQGTRKWFVPQTAASGCRFLSRTGRCLIYQTRPLVCRLHTCGKIEANYVQLKRDLYYAYQAALQVEMTNLLAKTGIRQCRQDNSISSNPVISKDNYDSTIAEIITWVRTHDFG